MTNHICRPGAVHVKWNMMSTAHYQSIMWSEHLCVSDWLWLPLFVKHKMSDWISQFKKWSECWCREWKVTSTEQIRNGIYLTMCSDSNAIVKFELTSRCVTCNHTPSGFVLQIKSYALLFPFRMPISAWNEHNNIIWCFRNSISVVTTPK